MERFWFGQVLENGMFVWPNLSASKKKEDCFWLPVYMQRKWNVSGWPNLSTSKKEKEKKKRNVSGYLCTSRENGMFLLA